MLETEFTDENRIPQDLIIARLAQSEQMRHFIMQMWFQNPALAAHAGQRVRDLLTAAVPPAPTFQR